jgi:hypothetical protein
MNAVLSLAVQGGYLQLPAIDGKQLLNNLEDLDLLAEELKLELLTTFLYLSKDEIDNLGVDMIDFVMPQNEWFEAEKLLETVFALRVHLEKQPHAIPNVFLVLPDLKALELALEICEANHTSVRLTIDT